MLPRLLGAATFGYAALVIIRPATMTDPIGLSDGAVDPGTEVLTRSMLARDLACGAAMMFAPPGWPLLTAIGIRVASDLGDAAVMGTSLPTAQGRRAALLVAGGYGALCALSALGARREDPPALLHGGS